MASDSISKPKDVYLNIGSIATQKTITASNTCSFLLVIYSNTASRNGLYILRMRTGYASTVATVLASSGATITEGIANVKIVSDVAAYAVLYPLTDGSLENITVT